jgi:metal-responsive CopG/Arc/MetJ family transcriptional regulator
MVRVTFSLDEATVAELKRTAARVRKPQSHVVREALADYAAGADRLSDSERAKALDILRRLRASGPSRTAADVDTELRGIRAARRAGGRQRRAR